MVPRPDVDRGGGDARHAGHAASELHGIPVAIKDLVELEGRITTGGSLVNRERVSKLTATLVRRMLAAGMIVLGKTHTVEFAAGGFNGRSGKLNVPKTWTRSPTPTPST